MWPFARDGKMPFFSQHTHDTTCSLLILMIQYAAILYSNCCHEMSLKTVGKLCIVVQCYNDEQTIPHIVHPVMPMKWCGGTFIVAGVLIGEHHLLCWCDTLLDSYSQSAGILLSQRLLIVMGSLVTCNRLITTHIHNNGNTRPSSHTDPLMWHPTQKTEQHCLKV